MTEFEENTSLEINNEGCYSTICVELDLASIAVNTLLESGHVNDIEGASAVSFDNPQTYIQDMLQGQGAATMLTSYDETALCAVTFRIMKSMVHGWIRDITNYQNVFADHQVIHFYRWLTSPASLLYDPALRRTLHNMMKKLFMQLVAEFKRLGSTIVHANFSRMIICTKKRQLIDALAYVEYITNTIRAKELYHMIDITYSSNWQLLLWLDPANFGGVRAKIPTPRNGLTGREGGEDSDEEQPNTPEREETLDQSDSEDDPEIEMNWNLVKFLPEAAACQTHFNMIIAGYIHAIFNHLENEIQSHTPGSTPVRRRGGSQTQPSIDATVTPGLLEKSQQLIEKDMCMQMFAITQKIQKKLSGSGRGDLSAEFPKLPGSYLPLNNPALEFIKYVCKVLSLDSNITNQVNKMRRDLLKLIGVGDFSRDADFQDPCLSYILPEVICKNCNSTRDVDLCRDPHLSDDAQSLWHCTNETCKTEYDVAEIEQHLIDAVQRKSMAHVLQDLKCIKCNGVKDTNMATYCKCAGDFTTTQSLPDVVQKLKIFRNIASHYNMPLLLETVEWILKMNHQAG